MSLTYRQIEQLLADGLYFSAGQREYSARSDFDTNAVVVNDMDRRWREQVPLDMIVDRVRADANGSELEDANALRRLLSEIVTELRP
jgi:hypothetical protein